MIVVVLQYASRLALRCYQFNEVIFSHLHVMANLTAYSFCCFKCKFIGMTNLMLSFKGVNLMAFFCMFVGPYVTSCTGV